VCCNDLNYSHEAKTIPGFTSGRPPRTRHEIDNARVIFTPVSVSADDKNNFTAHYEVSLGDTPLRGAVWIEPRLAGTTTLNLSITPPRVVLYNNLTTTTVSIQVLNPDVLVESSETLVLINAIESCDEAFTSFSDAFQNNILVIVDGPTVHQSRIIAWVVALAIVFFLTVLCVYVVHQHKRRQSDEFWIVNSCDLHFSDPPEILGQGTFGFVLLADYRGTPVAVKRVLPPSSKSTGASKLFSGDRKEQAINQRSGANNSSDIESGEADQSLSSSSESYKNPGLSSTGSMTTTSGLHSIVSINLTNRNSKQSDSKLKSDFVDEMRYLAKLRHPCVTTVLGKWYSRRCL
jgi:hypothetical protein